MKKTILSVFLITTSICVAQVAARFQEGKIWFKVKAQKTNHWQVAAVNGDVTVANISAFPLLTRLKEAAKIKSLNKPFALADDHSLSAIYELEFDNIQATGILMEQLRNDASVEYVERVPLDQLFTNDPYYNSQWNLAQVNATQAWSYSTGTFVSKVAVIDDAIEVTHNDLKMWVNTAEQNGAAGIDDDNNGYVDDINGYDVANGDGDPTNINYLHGTAVAGAVAAKSNNSIGIASLGYGSSVSIIAIKAKKNNTAGFTVTDGYKGILYAVKVGANVICMSWGSLDSSQTAQQIINYAHSKGCVLVAAAGNANTNTKFYPAGYNHVIAVASTDQFDKKAVSSNYGSWIDISAPGENILSTKVGNAYANASGTSISAGMVAGLAGLMVSYKPGITPNEVENCIKTNAFNINILNPNYVNQLGAGRLNAGATMNCLQTTFTSPKADFEANITSVVTGSKVIFTDKSAYYGNVLTRQWTFGPGVTIVTGNQSTPTVEVQYDQVGLYPVTLNVTTNAGSNSKTKPNYITVNQGYGCDTINFWRIADLNGSTNWNPGLGNAIAYYTKNDTGINTPCYINTPDTLAGGLFGPNNCREKEQAQPFSIAGNGGKNKLTRVDLVFGFANIPVNQGSKFIYVKVYDRSRDTVGSDYYPGHLLTISQPIAASSIVNDVASGSFTTVRFDPPVTIPTDTVGGIRKNEFFVSVAFSGGGIEEGNLDYITDKDFVGLVSTTPGRPIPTAPVYKKLPDNRWLRMGTSDVPVGAYQYGSSMAAFIFPYLTDQITDAVFTQNKDSICPGEYVVYDATGSTYQDTISWTFNGGIPSRSNKVIDTVFYAKSGSYAAQLIVRGGGCVDADTSVTGVVVKASPVFQLTTNPSSGAVCSGSTATVTASVLGTQGSYSWRPTIGLNDSVGTNVVITPTLPTQLYQVTGVSAATGCESTTSFYINIDSLPVAHAFLSQLSGCVGDTIKLDARASEFGSGFQWAISPASGVDIPNPTGALSSVLFNTLGSYTISLQVSNSCGVDSSYSSVININCVVGIDELLNDQNTQLIYNEANENLDLNINNPSIAQNINLKITNSMGQVVLEKTAMMNQGRNMFNFNMSPYAKGVYYVTIYNEQHKASKKVVIY